MSTLTREQLTSTWKRMQVAIASADNACDPDEERIALQDVVQLCDSLKVAATAQATSLAYMKRVGKGRAA